jgi:hypothetical protein
MLSSPGVSALSVIGRLPHMEVKRDVHSTDAASDMRIRGGNAGADWRSFLCRIAIFGCLSLIFYSSTLPLWTPLDVWKKTSRRTSSPDPERGFGPGQTTNRMGYKFRARQDRDLRESLDHFKYQRCVTVHCETASL